MFSDHPLDKRWANELAILKHVRLTLKPTDVGLCDAIRVAGRDMGMNGESVHLKWIIRKDIQPYEYLDSWISNQFPEYLTLPRAQVLAKMYNTRLAWLDYLILEWETKLNKLKEQQK